VRKNWPWILLSICLFVNVVSMCVALATFPLTTSRLWAHLLTLLTMALTANQILLQYRWRQATADRAAEIDSAIQSPLQSKAHTYYGLGLTVLFFSAVTEWFAAARPGSSFDFLPYSLVSLLLAYNFLPFARRQALSKHEQSTAELQNPSESSDPNDARAYEKRQFKGAFLVMGAVIVVATIICFILIRSFDSLP